MESTRQDVLTDRFAIHELKKISKFKKNKPMDDWLKLINAETEGDLMDIQKTTNIPEVRDTIVMLRQMSTDDIIRQEAYYREKRLHDEASALGHAKREGIEEVACSLLRMGSMSKEDITQATSLTLERIQELASEVSGASA